MVSWFRSIDVDDDEWPGPTGFDALVRAIDTDPAWRGWWSQAAFEYLEVRPTPVDGPSNRPLVLTSRNHFLLAQPSAELAGLWNVEPTGSTPAGIDAAELDRVRQAVLLTGLDNVGKILGLGPGPGRTVPFGQLSTPDPQSLEDLQHRAAHQHHPHEHHVGDPDLSGIEPEDAADSRLLPAQPQFLAHFRHRIYDADDYRNDDLMPFGTDEGADTVAEWNSRADELTGVTTLRAMLGPQADGFFAGRYSEDDLVIIATGFILLRFTARLDDEGFRCLLAAVDRQISRGEGREYRRMLKDLKAYRNP